MSLHVYNNGLLLCITGHTGRVNSKTVVAQEMNEETKSLIDLHGSSFADS